MLEKYRLHVAERAALGIPPLPLSADQTAELIELLLAPPAGGADFLLELMTYRVPAGVDVGSRLRVRGEGNAGRKGGPPGDLYVFVSVRADRELQRDGVDISSSVRIPYTDAILGTTVKVRTVDGPVDLKIPAGIQPGAVLVLAGKGVPRLGQPNQRGDHRVTVTVTIPDRPSPQEKALVEQLAALNKAAATK